MLNRRVILWAVVALLVGAGWMAFSAPRGAFRQSWTDQLRHQGEALALVEKGPRIYLGSYDQALEAVAPPCDEHVGLWGNLGIPYPPLALLLHWPLASAERAGLLSHDFSHRAQGLLAL